MGYKLRVRPCRVCGRQVTGRLPPDQLIRCAECGTTAAIDAIVQMANKSGPLYDKWLASRGPQGRPRKPSIEG